MAIQSRRGAYGDFDPNKMLPGEWASVLKDDPKAQDGKSVYMCFAAGDVKRMATYEDMKDNIKEATGDVVQEVTEEYAGEIKAATKAANDAASAAESATSAANTATGSANTAASSATAAAKAANDAAKNVKNDFYGAYADFPETGEENKMYIDTSSNPNKIYTWDSSSASYKLVSGGSEENPTYDVTLTLPVSGWVGDSAPYAQTVASAGMTADKSLVFAMISAGPMPTNAEYEAYGKITGVAQGVNSVTFYCNEKPTTELKIRAFCGAGSDEGTDLSIIGEGFNANKSYAIGDYCVNESSLWEFTAAKGAGAWDSSKVTQRSVIGLIQSLQSRVSTLETQVSALNAKSTFHRINVSGAVTPPSSDKFYTGIKVQIPANSYFSVTAFAAYENAPVTWIGLGESDTQIALCYRNANAGYNHASVSYSGFADKPLTLYVWAQWGNSSINSAAVTGYYVTQ